jgi:uncharacterized LabA/DUF88 family protein
MNDVTTFIDAAYFYHVKADLGCANVDFSRLAEELAGGATGAETRLYDALPFVSPHCGAEERARWERKRRFLDALSYLPGFVVRLGRTAFRGVSEAGAAIYQQKRVDTLIAVDLAVMAAKRSIRHAVLLAGDSDFVPAVQAARAEGTAVHLVHRGAHRDLIAACDTSARIDRAFMDRVARANFDRSYSGTGYGVVGAVA